MFWLASPSPPPIPPLSSHPHHPFCARFVVSHFHNHFPIFIAHSREGTNEEEEEEAALNE
jgi:hypothetical protein